MSLHKQDEKLFVPPVSVAAAAAAGGCGHSAFLHHRRSKVSAPFELELFWGTEGFSEGLMILHYAG